MSTCYGCDTQITRDDGGIEIVVGTRRLTVCRNGTQLHLPVAKKSCAQKAFLKAAWGTCAVCGQKTGCVDFRYGHVPATVCHECTANLEALKRAESLRHQVDALRAELSKLRDEQKVGPIDDRLLYELGNKLHRLLGEDRDQVGKLLALATTGHVTTRGNMPMFDTNKKDVTETILKSWLSSLDAAEAKGRERGRSFLLDLAAGTFEVDSLNGNRR